MTLSSIDFPADSKPPHFNCLTGKEEFLKSHFDPLQLRHCYNLVNFFYMFTGLSKFAKLARNVTRNKTVLLAQPNGEGKGDRVAQLAAVSKVI